MKGEIEHYFLFVVRLPDSPYKCFLGFQEIPRKCVIVKDKEYSYEEFFKIITEL